MIFFLKQKRFLSLYRPLNPTPNNYKKVYASIGVCFGVGLFCAAAPFFGWSYYSLEGALTSCSVEWSDRSFNVVSYNIFIFFFTFVIPLCVISFSNYGIYYLVNLNTFETGLKKNYFQQFETDQKVQTKNNFSHL